jgi:SAM-dependent methyltransferase
MTDRALREAGAAAVRFNAPLSDERAAHLIEAALTALPGVVVDYGCGRAELLLGIVAQGGAGVRGVGIDLDERALDTASANAAAREIGERTSFVALDATSYTGAADVAISIGASHAFGGFAAMLQRLRASRAIVADGFWAAAPDQWCLDTFGELPRGLPEVEAIAAAAGWDVAELDASTLDEWDAFEDTWAAGVAALKTDAAWEFAATRATEYRDHYRGVLGFAWLVLDR